MASTSENVHAQDAWLVTSPLVFENIGFTKGVFSNSASTSSEGPIRKALPDLPEGASIRYLACADCDCGPLGWHVESQGSDLGKEVEEEVGGRGNNRGPIKEFLLALERCRYKVE